jgi:hypothetical protein
LLLNGFLSLGFAQPGIGSGQLFDAAFLKVKMVLSGCALRGWNGMPIAPMGYRIWNCRIIAKRRFAISKRSSY